MSKKVQGCTSSESNGWVSFANTHAAADKFNATLVWPVGRAEYLAGGTKLLSAQWYPVGQVTGGLSAQHPVVTSTQWAQWAQYPDGQAVVPTPTTPTQDRQWWKSARKQWMVIYVVEYILKYILQSKCVSRNRPERKVAIDDLPRMHADRMCKATRLGMVH